VVVHASLKPVGWISGGANTVLDALLQVVGPQGTIVMSAQYPDNADPALMNRGVDPRVATLLRQSQPPFRGKSTVLSGLGALTTALQLDERSKISDHPALAVAAIGKHAKWITSEHPLSPAFGHQSPLAKAVELNAKALLIGVDYGVLSALHVAQVRSNCLPWGIHTFTIGSPEVPRTTRVLDYMYTTTDFNAIGSAYARQHPIHTGRLGHAPLLVIELASLIPFAQTWMERKMNA
jgi:aminoglycoside 3-N-acetyltransferase